MLFIYNIEHEFLLPNHINQFQRYPRTFAKVRERTDRLNEPSRINQIQEHFYTFLKVLKTRPFN